MKLFIILSAVILINAAPMAINKTKEKEAEPNSIDQDQWFNEVGYGKYLKEVVTVLENDPKFREILEKASPEDIKSGKIADHINLTNHHVRSKLDEIKRKEIERLIELQKMQSHRMEAPDHMDHTNAKFMPKDLKKLILKISSDMAETDEQRKKQFQEYEMEKELKYRDDLTHLTGEEKEKAIKQHQEIKEKHKNHPKLHHPGSKQQLEEVWEEQDHLEQNDFNPQTFFKLHDLDSNGHWDPNEVNILFVKELEKAYDAKTYDAVERSEEMERMRAQLFSDADSNRDGLISFQEFIDHTKASDFDEDEAWETFDDKPLYTDEELEAYGKNHGINSESEPSTKVETDHLVQKDEPAQPNTIPHTN